MHSKYIIIKIPIEWREKGDKIKKYIFETFTFDNLDILYEERCTIYIESDSDVVETLLEKFKRGL